MSAPKLTATPSTKITSVAWPVLSEHLDNHWEPGEHVSIIGQTGSGKSYLMRHGLMPLCKWDRVAVFDVKGDDPTWEGFGKPVKRIPRFHWKQSEPEHYRILVPDDVGEAQKIVRAELDRIYDEGDWVVVVDELRALTDPRPPNLGLQPLLDRMWLRGRSRRITLVAGTQAPRWVPSSFYDQPSHVFISRIRDTEIQRRAREIGGFDRSVDPVLNALPKQDWLYVGDSGDVVFHSKVGTS